MHNHGWLPTILVILVIKIKIRIKK